MGFNDLVRSVFQGYKEVKESRDPYEVLDKAWYLYQVDDLNHLTDGAKKKDQYNVILDHLYKWDATRVDYYKDIEHKIIDRMWD
jgi:hypothetical protein